MLDIIGKRNWYFLFSLILIIPGLISLALFGLKLSIDFTGGSRVTLLYPSTVNERTVQSIKDTFTQQNVVVSSVQVSGNKIIVRSVPIDEKKDAVIVKELQKKDPNFKQEEFETIGPVIGGETTLNAVKSVALASLLIVLYIAWSFRKVPKPASSWRFGICAVLALIHDALVLLGIFSILGHFFHVEVDSLFVTAVLTVIGFSVHDTIVVFDRVRENLVRKGSTDFSRTVNDSILQTMTRSLNTSFTALLVLFALLLFGGENIRWFILALVIGIACGTYSSIFNAAPLLVTWQEWDNKRKKKQVKK